MFSVCPPSISSAEWAGGAEEWSSVCEIVPGVFQGVKHAQIGFVCWKKKKKSLRQRGRISSWVVSLYLKKINNPPHLLRFFQLRQKKSLGGKAASYCIIKAFLCSNKKGCSGQLGFKKKIKKEESVMILVWGGKESLTSGVQHWEKRLEIALVICYL